MTSLSGLSLQANPAVCTERVRIASSLARVPILFFLFPAKKQKKKLSLRGCIEIRIVGFFLL